VELYSLGQSFDGYQGGVPATYVFGFAGVGGVPVPEPSASALLAFGAGLFGAARQRIRRVSNSRTS